MIPHDFRYARQQQLEREYRASQHQLAADAGYLPLDRRIIRWFGVMFARASARLLNEPGLLQQAKTVAASKPASPPKLRVTRSH